MRLVDKPVMNPHHCAALPYVGQSSAHRFVDTGTEMSGFDQRVYISVPAVETMASLIGWFSPDAQSRLCVELGDALARVDELEAENDRLETVLAAIDTMESADFRARKKAGRPPKIKDEVAA